MLDEIDFRDGAMPWQEPPRRRSRFVKWIVSLGVIGFVGLLIGFLLPKVQSSGRSTPRTQCAHHLNSIGFGIDEYLDTYNVYPPGTVPNPDLPLDRRLGWGITILPFAHIERAKTADEIARLGWDDPSFTDLTDHPFEDMYCHSSKTRASYVAIAGLGIDAPSLPTKHPRAGIFGDDRKVTPADIKDGTSHTMMLTESASLPGPWFAGGRANVQGLNNLSQPYIGSNRQFGGLHDGGANVLMADGSIRFLSDSIDPKAFEALSTINGGEAVPTENP
jgi:prepilin-type processing-associated H-X9-DG protein